MKFKGNYKIIFISITIVSIFLITAVYAINDSHKTVVIDTQSEYGRELTAIAEKAIEEEGIDTNYIHLRTIYYEYEDSIMVKFEGAKRYSNGVVYSHANLGEDETITFFAANLDRYGVYTYYVQPENGRIYDKNVVTMSETYGQGKDYKYNIQDNSIELIDPVTNKVMFVLSDYEINKDEDKADTIADEINTKYDNAQQPLPINKDKPYIIMDLTMNDEDGWLLIDVNFYKEQLNFLHIEEGIKSPYTTTISNTVKYYDENGDVIPVE
ncbi:hypothetical protein SAMN04488589_1502 [Methanolobus vulcani]|uniref:Uncharacterized protein n=1 Tax=Methanolobus vulcani TaxID=38026 RepID=A0A7Z7AZF4_9EURY|nr:hypothetical protein [Methanolobus vulcani]SDF84587.1 hypothetical protein SAMN04488589_1502 [Methanolobus vulcani]